MATIKNCTDLPQSKKLAEFLLLESADMCFNISQRSNMPPLMIPYSKFNEFFNMEKTPDFLIPCWSLTALLEELNRNCWNVSLKCCGAEWDMTYDDGEIYISVPSDYAIDACYGLIIKLHEQKLL